MAEPIIITPNLVSDPQGCMPGNRQELANFVAQAFTAMFNGAQFALWNFGPDTPPPENQDRPWFRTEASGRAIGPYSFFNGSWKRAAGIPVQSIISYSGPSSVFDGTGKGTAGTQADGFNLCNSQNGTPDLRNRFVIGASSTTSPWTSTVSILPLATGGASSVTIRKENLPELTFTLPIGAADGGNDRFVFGNATAGGTYERSIPGTGNGASGSGDPGVPISILPPYYALAFIQYNP